MVSWGLYCSVRHLIIVDDCLINLLIDKASHHNLHILNFKVAVYIWHKGTLRIFLALTHFVIEKLSRSQD